LAQTNVDGTPNLQDSTTVRDLGVEKAEENNDVTYSKWPSRCTVESSSASNCETESGKNVGHKAKRPVEAKEDGTPFDEDETPPAKHARLTRVSSRVIANAPRPWPGLRYIATVAKVDRIKRN
jgi:hypothetical protein